jgi:hypothetical protein
MPEMSKDVAAALQRTANDGDALHDLINHPGWKDVLLPRLMGLREATVGQMIADENLSLQGFQLCQQSVKAIDTLTKGIGYAIDKGEKAKAELKKRTQRAETKV